MREIKFRAWDKVKKEWLLGYELPNLGGFSLKGEMMMMGEYASLLSSYFPDRIDDIVLMQFTGLHDKNGKEMYEGDITARGIITFSNGKFQGTYYDSNGNLEEDWEDDLYKEKNLEVIGNIYDNPELLN